MRLKDLFPLPDIDQMGDNVLIENPRLKVKSSGLVLLFFVITGVLAFLAEWGANKIINDSTKHDPDDCGDLIRTCSYNDQECLRIMSKPRFPSTYRCTYRIWINSVSCKTVSVDAKFSNSATPYTLKLFSQQGLLARYSPSNVANVSTVLFDGTFLIIDFHAFGTWTDKDNWQVSISAQANNISSNDATVFGSRIFTDTELQTITNVNEYHFSTTGGTGCPAQQKVYGFVYGLTTKDDENFTKEIYVKSRSQPYKRFSEFGLTSKENLDPVFPLQEYISIENNASTPFATKNTSILYFQTDYESSEITVVQALDGQISNFTRKSEDKVLVIVILIPKGKLTLSEVQIDGDDQFNLIDGGLAEMNSPSKYLYLQSDVNSLQSPTQIESNRQVITIQPLDAKTIGFTIKLVT